MRKELGKITSIKFGYGGYQDAQLGLSLMFGGESWGCGTFWGHWGTDRSPSAEWTEESRIETLGATVMKLKKLLDDAKVQTVDELQGIPVECQFDGNQLVDFRILKEVL